MLYRRELPGYTTERYYILSEIEQAASFDFSYEASDGQGYSADVEEDKKYFYYVLWDAEKGLNSLKSDISKLCGQISRKREGKSAESDEKEEDSEFFNRAKYFMGIEVLVSKESQAMLDKRVRTGSNSEGTSEIKSTPASHTEHEIEKAHKWIQETYQHVDFVAFGTSDKVSGTPAIEILQQIVCFAYRNIDPSNKMVRVLRMEALLGHDENREPDAESDVTQALYTSRAFSPPETKESKIDYGLISSPLITAMAFGGIMAAICAMVSVFFSSYFNDRWFQYLFGKM